MSQSIELLVGEAQALKRAGRISEAIDVWRRVVAQEPENLVYQHDLAAILGDDGRNAEAADIAGNAISRGLDSPETHLVYGRALVQILELERAEAAYRKVLAKRPDDAIAHRELAQLLWMRTGDAAKSEAVIVDAIKQQPGLLSLQIMLAEIKGQTGDPKAQYELLKEILDTTGRHPQVCYFAARAALSCKEFTAARDYSKQAFEATPDQDDVAAVYVTALLATGDAPSALKIVERLRVRRPDNQYFIALQATAWRLLGDERYNAVFDYDAMIYAAPLDTPSGWSALDHYLEELEAALMDAHCYRAHPFFLSVRHGSQIASITRSENPAMAAFAQAVRGPLEAYLDRMGPGDDPLRARRASGFTLLDAWSVLLPPSGFHVNHVHPAGWLSSACHIRPPEEDPDNSHAGWLKFGEPGCVTEPPLAAEKHIKPEAGKMVIFPSYMWHGTEAFTKGSARLTVAVDAAPGAAG